ncbi:MAG: hypothetical protein RR056_07355, partial [Acetivibrio sp.]
KKSELSLKGVTPLVRPTKEDVSCGCEGILEKQGNGEALNKSKAEIIEEVVRRVAQQLNA